MKKIILSTLILSTMLVGTAFADKSKKARPSDTADRYELEDGTLYRYFDKTRLKCVVSRGVHDFKISQHPRDAAVVYYIQNGDLFVLHNVNNTDRQPQFCPPESKKKILDNVAKVDGKYKYSVVSSTNTEIVNTALSSSGKLVAWDNTKQVYSAEGIRDYSMNQCNDQKGAAFQRYALFAKDGFGRVLKIDGDNPEKSDFDHQFRGNIAEFKEEKGVCKLPGQQQRQHKKKDRRAEFQRFDDYDSAYSAE